MSSPDADLWVFGYGSLMWRPGFDFIEKHPATLAGYHRALCVYSHVHRGTEQQPGLVFGLDDGGNCRGIVFRVAAENAPATIKYLRAREQATAVYIERSVDVTLDDRPDHKISALTYLVDHKHKQYAGVLSLKEQLKFVIQGHGQSGPCRDYIIATARHLEELGVDDKNIQTLASSLSGS